MEDWKVGKIFTFPALFSKGLSEKSRVEMDYLHTHLLHIWGVR